MEKVVVGKNVSIKFIFYNETEITEETLNVSFLIKLFLYFESCATINREINSNISFH